jgi:hypothetical protein
MEWEGMGRNGNRWNNNLTLFLSLKYIKFIIPQERDEVE